MFYFYVWGFLMMALGAMIVIVWQLEMRGVTQWSILGYDLPITRQANQIYTIGWAITFVIWFFFLLIALRGERKLFPLGMVAFLLLVCAISGSVVGDRIIFEQGFGTIQAHLDDLNALTQDDMKLKGNLGYYAGLWQEELDGVDQARYYVCIAIDNFGPFATPIMEDAQGEPTSLGAESYIRAKVASEHRLYSFANYQFDDGYWVVAKTFVAADDVNIQVEHLDDLRIYLERVEFKNHRSFSIEPERSLMNQLQEEYGHVLKRTSNL